MTTVPGNNWKMWLINADIQGLPLHHLLLHLLPPLPLPLPLPLPHPHLPLHAREKSIEMKLHTRTHIQISLKNIVMGWAIFHL